MFTRKLLFCLVCVSIVGSAIPARSEQLVRFEWSGVVSSDGSEVLTNSNIAPGESWTLVHEFDATLPETSSGRWTDPTRSATISFEGGYSTSISMNPGMTIEALQGTVDIVSIFTGSGIEFQATVVHVPGTFQTFGFPLVGTYQENISFSTGSEIFHLVNSDGEVRYQHDAGSVALTITALPAVPASSSGARAWMVMALIVVSAGSWKRVRRSSDQRKPS